MKKFLRGFLTLFMGVALSLNVSVSNTYAYDVPSTIRIGLEYKYKDVLTVPISNKKIEFGYNAEDNFISLAEFSSESGFTMNVSYKNYFKMLDKFNNFEDAKRVAENFKNYGYTAFPVYIGNEDWNVYINSENKNLENLGYNFEEITASKDYVELRVDNVPIFGVDNGEKPQFKAIDKGKVMLLGDRSYRGAIEFGRYTQGRMTAVNVIDFDEYLYGVVPSEMPSSWEMEALKAQAVTARTYAISKTGTHNESGYDLCDGVNCQVYNGYGNEAGRTNEAIDETSGIMIYYNDEPINAVFSASSGGYTDNSENVWTLSLPYLRAVVDNNEYEPVEWTRTITTSQLNSLASAHGKNIGAATDIVISKVSENGRIQELKIVGTNGSFTLNKEEIRTFFAGAGGSLNSRIFKINGVGVSLPSSSVNMPNNIETINNISKTNEKSKNDSMYVLGEKNTASKYSYEDLYIMGSNGNVSSGRLAFSIVGSDGNIIEYDEKADKVDIDNKINNSIDISNINNDVSSQYKTVNLSTSNGSGIFIFSGRGNGHGVGMSQRGAQGLAKLGYTYEQILNYYYTGIEVK